MGHSLVILGLRAIPADKRGRVQVSCKGDGWELAGGVVKEELRGFGAPVLWKGSVRCGWL